MDNQINNYKNCTWDNITYSKFINYLKSISEVKYKNFQSKLIPNNRYEMLGIRIPILRKIANIIYKNNYSEFLKICKNNYFEEIMIKSIIISKIKDIKKIKKYIDEMIPYLNNWALCDAFVSSMKCIKNNLEYFYNFFSKYNNRITIVVYLNYYLNDEYIDRVFNKIESIKTDDYYINMAISWLLCEAYVNYRNKVIKYLNICTNNDIIKMTKSKIRDSKKNKGVIL